MILAGTTDAHPVTCEFVQLGLPTLRHAYGFELSIDGDVRVGSLVSVLPIDMFDTSRIDSRSLNRARSDITQGRTISLEALTDELESRSASGGRRQD